MRLMATLWFFLVWFKSEAFSQIDEDFSRFVELQPDISFMSVLTPFSISFITPTTLLKFYLTAAQAGLTLLCSATNSSSELDVSMSE